VNPRRKGKQSKPPNSEFFRGRRYPIEQFNSHSKHNILKGCWVRPKGLTKKTSMVMAGLVSMEANAIEALLRGDSSLKNASKYWDYSIQRRIWRWSNTKPMVHSGVTPDCSPTTSAGKL
ncbi:hypothetical protein MUP38_08420, partial [Candidatus Bathyarchaeota archaeon]|nr:hypothetical protein [Candidatus Bathyarchaeota archaeon]